MLQYETIGDVYSANDEIRSRLLSLLGTISSEEAEIRPEGEAWNIRQIVEHLSMVEAGALRICAKLLEGAKAAGIAGDGKIELSPTFGEKATAVAGIKIDAPERVQPSGALSVEESVAKLEQARVAFAPLRTDFESYDLSQPRFPHPFFGELTAAEWLIVLGGHEARHTKQIERILAAIRQ